MNFKGVLEKEIIPVKESHIVPCDLSNVYDIIFGDKDVNTYSVQSDNHYALNASVIECIEAVADKYKDKGMLDMRTNNFYDHILYIFKKFSKITPIPVEDSDEDEDFDNDMI